MDKINKVDICCGLNWGDEAKGKIISHLTKKGTYDFVCRWAGGNNAGHTIYLDGIKYKTHLIPSGVFHGIHSIIGPGCVVNPKSFFEEINYLKGKGFNCDLIKISPRAHIVTDEHIQEDILKYKDQGTTAKGIAPCYRDKYARKGILAQQIPELSPYIWDEQLYGDILCEGAQGFWLDIDYGNYPYTTSSTTLPYAACSLGFPPQMINNIIGASKIYDTRSGNDPLFPPTLLDNPELKSIAECGDEIGTTTGRGRLVNWVNLDKLIKSINISGTTIIVISKVDVLEHIKLFKLIYQDNIQIFPDITKMCDFIIDTLTKHCSLLQQVIFSDNPEYINL